MAFIGFLSYRNGMRANFKGKSIGLYAFLTIVAFIVGEIVGGLVVIFLFCRDLIHIASAGNPKAIAEMQEQINQAFAQNSFHSITVELFGIGGYLLIRYIIEQMPEKSKPKVPLWPDNENAQ